MKKNTARICLFILALMTPQLVVAADYTARLSEAGTRDYYCTTTVEIENHSGESLTAINAFVDLVGSNGLIATSRGIFAGPIETGSSLEVTMEAPNEPCQNIETYVLVIGTCQIGRSFLDSEECAASFSVEPPFTGVRVR